MRLHKKCRLIECFLLLKSSNQRGEAALRTIYITEPDIRRLNSLIDEKLRKDTNADKSIKDLQAEIGRAKVVAANDLPGDIITMNTRALIRLNGAEREITLVYPNEADLWGQRISVLSPIGIAVLGYREGEEIEWTVPSGTVKVHIKKILYQPEAAGDYEL